MFGVIAAHGEGEYDRAVTAKDQTHASGLE
jgi:hypothetical protein